MNSSLAHCVGPLLAIIVALVVSRVRGIDFRDGLGLRPPAWRAAAVWLTGFVVLVVLEEALSPVLGIAPVAPWGGRYAGTDLALRLLGMVVLAPAAEELVFRGLLFDRLRRTRLGAHGAIALAAVLFAAAHLQYGPVTMLLIVVDGLYFGYARLTSGSVLLPFGLHALGNLYAAFQRLP